MKKYFLLLAGLLFFHYSYAQFQPRQGRVFELNNHNVHTIAREVYDAIGQSPRQLPPPSLPEITQFLERPFINNLGSQYNTQDCSNLDLSVYTTIQDGIVIHFGNNQGANPNNNRFMMASLNYRNHNQVSSTHFNINNNNVLNGVDLPRLAVQFQILLLARICDNCSTNTSDCFSNVEVIIVDKNLL